MDKAIFDEIIPRRGTDSCKWDKAEEEGIIPMWVADMDFRAAPAIIEALQKKVDLGIFGYTWIPQEYYDAIINWFDRRHGWEIRRETILSVPSVVSGVAVVLRALTKPGDKVILQNPAYNCFFRVIRNSGCILSANELAYEDGKYTIDWEDLEERAADPEAKVLILCNPHNPSGRVWTRRELERIADICLRHSVFVISDEIHCELTARGHDYTPFGTLSEEVRRHSVTCGSPSKAFNIAGLQNAFIVSEDAEVRKKLAQAIDECESGDLNPFGVRALIAAYNDSGDWLDALKEYLYDNYLCLKEFFGKHFPEFKVVPLEGTYLAWIDCRASGMSSHALADLIYSKCKVYFNPGDMYGDDHFLRVNLACPRPLLKEALNRLIPLSRELREK